MIHFLHRVYWHNFLGQKITSGPVAQLGVQALRSTGPAKIASCTITFSEIVQNKQIRACSAVGSAPHSHCGGRRFESDQVHQEKPWNLRFHGFFLTFLSFWWARSQAVSYHFYKMAPASFASPLPFPGNHLIEARNSYLPDHKLHGNAWFASKQVAQSGSHLFCALSPYLF